MYRDTYVFTFTFEETIRIKNAGIFVEALFQQHNSNGQRYLAKDKDSVIGLLREAEAFIDMNIGKGNNGYPTVHPGGSGLTVFRADVLTAYRISRAMAALENIWLRLPDNNAMDMIDVRIFNLQGESRISQVLIPDMHRRSRAILAALADNILFWAAKK